MRVPRSLPTKEPGFGGNCRSIQFPVLKHVFEIYFALFFILFLGNIQDIRVPVAGTSASVFEVKESDKKKKGGKNVNWNLQVNFQEAEWPSG